MKATKFLSSLLLATLFVTAASAFPVAPVRVVNTYVNTTAEQISSNTSITACAQALVCNESQSNKAVVNNSSSVTATSGKVLWPNAGTATTESRCDVLPPLEGYSTYNLTTWYGLAVTGNIRLSITCIPSTK